MPTLCFDAAHLADAVGKAARIAPRNGPGADKSAGLVLTASATACEIKASDTELHYWQVIAVSEAKDMDSGQVVQWRLPSGVISKLANTFPLDQSLVVKLIDNGDGWLRLSAGRTKAKLPMIPMETYPQIRPISRDGMVDANEFASKIAQVSWATAKTEVLSGVHINGEILCATDRYVLATVPCAVQVNKPITVPIGSLAGLVKDATDVKLRADDNRLEMALDAETSAACPIFGEAYPNVGALARFEADAVGKIQFNKSSFIETLDRMLIVVAGEKMPSVMVTMRETDLLLDIEEPELGRIHDSIDCTFQQSENWNLAVPPEHLSFYVTPAYIKSAVNACKSGRITVSFGHSDPKLHGQVPIVVSDDTGYKAYVQPRQKKVEV